MKIIFRFLYTGMAVLGFHEGFCQIITPGYYLNQLDKGQDSTTLSLYTYTQNSSSSPFDIEPLVFQTSFNSSYPRGFNDGPVWNGKGVTLQTSFGFSGQKGKFTYSLYPTILFSQNADYELATVQNSRGPYAYQFANNRIDWVQQFGTDPFAYFHLGQSQLKFQTGKFVAALSTQNYSLGPANFNPILLSSQGAGFPHIRVGNSPAQISIKDIQIGKIEFNFLFGLLEESDYFDANSSNDIRFYNAGFLGFSPDFIPGLTVGINRALYKNIEFFEPADLLSNFYIFDTGVRGDSISTNDTFDQLASISVNWNFPSLGFRAYGEFAKNDFSGSTRWSLLEPEHSRGFTVGFEREIITKKLKKIKMMYEHTTLSLNNTFLWRPAPPFYAHGINRQGYTHQGQLLGAGIGPGGTGDNIGITMEDKKAMLGLLLQRIENNRDYFVKNIPNISGKQGNHDVEYSVGFFFKKDLSKLSLISEITLSHNFNRYYDSDASNLFMMIGAQYNL